MGIIRHQGFTIIETMLFLAITGLLVAGVLVGTGTSINVQRYRDSVATLKSTITEQYSAASNTRNDGSIANLSCDSNAVVAETGTTLPRGQADCILIGRYVTIDDSTITTAAVVASKAPSSAIYSSDIAELLSYNYSVLENSKETSSLEWGAQIAWPVSGSGAMSPTTPRQISILVLRSPKSGLTYTFTGNGVVSSVKSLIVAGPTAPGQAQRRICVDSGGLTPGGSAVFIGAYASAASAIETRTNDMGDNAVC